MNVTTPALLIKRPLGETTRTNISSTVSDQQVATLPIRGRNFLDLVSLTPNVVSDPRLGDLSFGGQRGTFNSLQIDGADNNNSFFGQALGRTGSGRAPYQFSNDAVQEFQVNTNGFSAEFGRAAGGSINVVTKSGTNNWHGTAFEFFRDQSLNANRPNFITARNGLVPVSEPYHFNQFGGLIGGPIKKDKAFIFFNYDGQRNTRPVIMALGVAAPATPAAQAGLQRLLPFVNNYTLGFNQDVYLTKFDWQLDQVNRLSVRHNAQRFTGRNLENSGATSAQEHSGAPSHPHRLVGDGVGLGFGEDEPDAEHQAQDGQREERASLPRSARSFCDSALGHRRGR